jgi:hypothetical protein
MEYLTTPVITQDINVDIKDFIVNNISSKEFNAKYCNNLLVYILLQAEKLESKMETDYLNNQKFIK